MLKRLFILFLIERVGFYIYREVTTAKAKKEVKEILDDMHLRKIKNTN